MVRPRGKPWKSIIIEGVSCPFCNSTDKIHAHGHKHGKRCLICWGCGRSFVDPAERDIRPKVFKLSDFNSRAEYQQAYRERYGATVRSYQRAYHQTYSQKHSTLRASIFESPIPEVPIVIEKRPLPSVDNLHGIPCFGCKFNEREGSCDPTSCVKLDTWLELRNYPLMIQVNERF